MSTATWARDEDKSHGDNFGGSTFPSETVNKFTDI